MSLNRQLGFSHVFSKSSLPSPSPENANRFMLLCSSEGCLTNTLALFHATRLYATRSSQSAGCVELMLYFAGVPLESGATQAKSDDSKHIIFGATLQNAPESESFICNLVLVCIHLRYPPAAVTTPGPAFTAKCCLYFSRSAPAYFQSRSRN